MTREHCSEHDTQMIMLLWISWTDSEGIIYYCLVGKQQNIPFYKLLLLGIFSQPCNFSKKGFGKVYFSLRSRILLVIKKFSRRGESVMGTGVLESMQCNGSVIISQEIWIEKINQSGILWCCNVPWNFISIIIIITHTFPLAPQLQ